MDYGRFVNEVVTTWLVDEKHEDRAMQLEASFSYIDPDGLQWDAPAGRKVDGASIPEWLWGPITGTPFTGDYRRASVVHDIACQDKPYTSDDVHKMFYYAMLCDGTSKWRAKTFYAAVKSFGPQWGNGRKSLQASTRNIRKFAEVIQSDDFLAAATPDDIDKLLTPLLMQIERE